MNIKHSLKQPIYLSSVSIKKKTETKVNKTIGLDFNLTSIILYPAKMQMLRVRLIWNQEHGLPPVVFA